MVQVLIVTDPLHVFSIVCIAFRSVGHLCIGNRDGQDLLQHVRLEPDHQRGRPKSVVSSFVEEKDSINLGNMYSTESIRKIEVTSSSLSFLYQRSKLS